MKSGAASPDSIHPRRNHHVAAGIEYGPTMNLAFPFLLAMLAGPQPEHGLRYGTPASSWDEALPLGNGLMGALVWGDGAPLRVSLDHAGLWDLRRVPEFSGPDYKFARLREWRAAGRFGDIKRVYEAPYNRPAPTKIPAGRIEIELPGAYAESSLDLAAAEAQFRTAGARVSLFVHATAPAGMMRIETAATPELRLRAPAFRGEIKDGAQGGISPGDLQQLGYPAPEESHGANFRAYRQQGAEGFVYAAHVAGRRRGAGWDVAGSIMTGGAPPAPAGGQAETALAKGYAEMRASHAAWWAGYWRQSSVSLPNAILERQWHLEQYKFGSAARRGAPPITLQAVWTADNGKLPPWKGDYHHDLNTELSYWPCYTGNHLEEGLGFLDWLWATRAASREWTREFFELPGLNVPMTADLNGRQIGGWVQYTHSPTTAAWLAHHFYLHWRYSLDREFLRTRAYPYLAEAAEFLEAFTRERDARGKRTIPLSASPEINDNRPSAWFDEATNYDLALSRWLFGAAAELAAELGRDGEARRWRTVSDELPALALAPDGALLVAPGVRLPESHRHFSHLMAFHPLGLVDIGTDRRTVEASLAELEGKGTSRWTGYSFAWLGSLAARARDGAKAERALEIFSTAFTLRNSFHVNGDQSGKGYSQLTYRPFTLEGNFAAAAGIQEMLLQSHRGVLDVFPAIPPSWTRAAFGTLRAEGAFLVSAEMKDGRVTRLEIFSERGGLLRVRLPGEAALIERQTRPGERLALR